MFACSHISHASLRKEQRPRTTEHSSSPPPALAAVSPAGERTVGDRSLAFPLSFSWSSSVWMARPHSSSCTANHHFKGITRGAERKLALESCWHRWVGLALENRIHMFKEIFEPLGSSLPSTIQKILFGAESFLTKAPLALTLS